MSENGPDDLSERIAAAQRAQTSKAHRPKDDADQAGSSAGAQALRYGFEFGVNVAVGIGLGLLIDYYAGTKPWGMLIMMVFGFAAGIRGIVRAYRELTAEAEKLRQGGPSGPTEEEKKT